MMTKERLHEIRTIVHGACRCGSGQNPRECVSHPELYRLHVASLNVECYFEDGYADASAQDRAVQELQVAQVVAISKRSDAIRDLLVEYETLRDSHTDLVAECDALRSQNTQLRREVSRLDAYGPE